MADDAHPLGEAGDGGGALQLGAITGPALVVPGQHQGEVARAPLPRQPREGLDQQGLALPAGETAGQQHADTAVRQAPASPERRHARRRHGRGIEARQIDSARDDDHPGGIDPVLRQQVLGRVVGIGDHQIAPGHHAVVAPLQARSGVVDAVVCGHERDARRAAAARARRTSRAKASAKYKAEAHNRTATPPREQVEGRQKVRTGVVVSDKADKTITVRIDVARRHRRYSKIVRTSQTLHAHDERNDAHIGDTVTIREARPLSRLKRWRLIDVLERAR